MGIDVPRRRSPEYVLRPATGRDADAVTRLVADAYGHYVARIGGPPGPMRADYRRVISDRDVTVAVTHGSVVGVLVLAVTVDGFLIENVAVHPSHQGRGLGRALLELADDEARRAGFDSIYLYTHEKMTENLALYAGLGFVEFDRRSRGRLLPRVPAKAAVNGSSGDGGRGYRRHRHNG